MKCFVDTNVLVYAKDSRSPSKQKTARSWIEALIGAGRLVISAQSLREFYAVSLRRDRSTEAALNARLEIQGLAEFVPENLFIDRLGEAWSIQDRHQLGFWDSLLLASALAGGCTTFLSEDLSSGQQIESLTIINPFKTTPDAVLGSTES